MEKEQSFNSANRPINHSGLRAIIAGTAIASATFGCLKKPQTEPTTKPTVVAIESLPIENTFEARQQRLEYEKVFGLTTDEQWGVIRALQESTALIQRLKEILSIDNKSWNSHTMNTRFFEDGSLRFYTIFSQEPPEDTEWEGGSFGVIEIQFLLEGGEMINFVLKRKKDNLLSGDKRECTEIPIPPDVEHEVQMLLETVMENLD